MLGDDAPAWAHDAFARTLFAVVRRAPPRGTLIAIGLRGETRGQRHAAWAASEDVESVVIPEQLVCACPAETRAWLPAFAALRLLIDASWLENHAWGPVGSTGFELATGVETVTPSSDLDLVIRAPAPLSREAAAALHARLLNCAVEAAIRVDVQLDTPAGGVALAEWAAGKPQAMVRTPNGPVLAADPWRENEPEQGDHRC